MIENTVDTSIPGIYIITYTAMDTAGNDAVPVMREVTVTVAPDAIPPVIFLVGNATENIFVGDSYVDAGATATDNIDGDITANIISSGVVDIATPGVYSLTYNVNDSAGNAATAILREVTVSIAPDTTPPVILLNGNASESIVEGTSYVDAGATASDNIDGEISTNIITTNPVVNTTSNPQLFAAGF